MQDKIHLSIITVDGTRYEKMVHYVSVPLKDGEAGILANHAPLRAAVKDGPVKCKFADTVEYLYAGNGVVDIRENQVTLLVRAAEAARNIDLSRAQASERRARERIRHKDRSTDLDRAAASLQRALARQKAWHLLCEK